MADAFFMKTYTHLHNISKEIASDEFYRIISLKFEVIIVRQKKGKPNDNGNI